MRELTPEEGDCLRTIEPATPRAAPMRAQADGCAAAAACSAGNQCGVSQATEILGRVELQRV